MKNMTTPNRWKLVGNWKYEVTGKVLDVTNNEEFDGKLQFTGTCSGIETSEINGVRKAELHTEVVKLENRSDMWELIVYDEPKNDKVEKREYGYHTLITLGLTNDQLARYVDKLIKSTKQSPEQIHKFIVVLVKRFDKLVITSLKDLYVRFNYDKSHSEQIELLKEVAGVYHLNNLLGLMNILITENNSKDMIKYFDRLIEKEQEKKSKFDFHTEEYRNAVENEIRWLENKKHYINKLI
jgi:hypothetical protein